MRIRTTRSLPVCLLALITAVFFGQSAFGWQDEDGRVGLSHGRVDLSPAEDAENQDADGGAKLLQVGDRSAIHVNVSGARGEVYPSAKMVSAALMAAMPACVSDSGPPNPSPTSVSMRS